MKSDNEKDKTKERLVLGKVSRPRGLRGEFFLDSGVPPALEPGVSLRVTPPGADYQLQSLARPKDRALMKLAGVDTIEAAEALRGAEVSVERESLGTELLLSDLVGCTLIDADSAEPLGIVAACMENPAHPLIELDNGMLIPFVPEFFPQVDLAARKIVARLPPGLDEL